MSVRCGNCLHHISEAEPVKVYHQIMQQTFKFIKRSPLFYVMRLDSLPGNPERAVLGLKFVIQTISISLLAMVRIQWL